VALVAFAALDSPAAGERRRPVSGAPRPAVDPVGRGDSSRGSRGAADPAPPRPARRRSPAAGAGAAHRGGGRDPRRGPASRGPRRTASLGRAGRSCPRAFRAPSGGRAGAAAEGEPVAGAAPSRGRRFTVLERLVIRFHSAAFSYGKDEPVLAGVDLEISSGLTLLLGPNGCGKSTLLKLAAGIERPDAGRVEIDGHDLWVDEAAARRGLAYVPEQPDLTPYATVREILDLVCRLRGAPREQGWEALEQVGLGKLAHRSVRELSMGQRRRAVLAAAFIGTPSHVLLDEPLEALDRGAR